MKPPYQPIQVSSYTATSAVGWGKAPLLEAVLQHRSGLRPLEPSQFAHANQLNTWIGQVDGLEQSLPKKWASWDCRNNRLAWLGLQQDDFLRHIEKAKSRYGANRVAVIMGTSTSSIGATEEVYIARKKDNAVPHHASNQYLHTLHSLTSFVVQATGLHGPNYTLSTACSSSAKAFCAAERLLRLHLVDAVVVGGVDSICASVLFGFHSLQLLSPDPCQPFDFHRKGINIGEAAGFALLERSPGELQLIGYGESSDAHHMSSPHPQGLGAETALNLALASAKLNIEKIDYLHLHGTATPKNDEIEASLVKRRFSEHAFASSTKGMTGHTLGAAGILGATFSLLALEHGWLPGTVNTTELDTHCGPQIKIKPQQKPIKTAASHSFAFGGSNCILIWGRT